MAGRHRRRVRRAAIAGGVAGVLVLGAGAWFVFFRDQGEQVVAARHRARCASARVAGRIGELAWVDHGRLVLRDLDTCRTTTLVRRGAARPVRFDPQGHLVGFGDAAVVSVEGGRVRHPIGRLDTWQWTGDGHALAGVTPSGRLIEGSSRASAVTLLRHGGKTFAFSSDGGSVAVGVRYRLEVVSLNATTNAVRTLYSGPKKDTVEVAGWSPDGRWVVFFVERPDRTGAALDVAPSSASGGYHNVFDPVLPYADFLSWCGETLEASGGDDRFPSEGQQLLASSPSEWRTHNLSADFRSSWYWPACSPDGKAIAVTLSANHVEEPPGDGRRSLWLISADGDRRTRLAGGSGKAYEAPRWSARGRFVLVVQRGHDPKSEGELVLIQVNPKSGKAVRTVGSLATLPPPRNERGHLDWSSSFDWFQPAAARAGGAGTG